MIKTNYDRYKEKGICVRCGKDEAMINSYHCPDCAEKKAKYRAKQWLKIKKDPKQLSKYCEYHREYYKKIVKRREEAGLCKKCGKRKPCHGKKQCVECLIKNRREIKKRREKKRKLDIPRSEYQSNGLCYMCGQPWFEKHKLCEKHYKRSVEILTKYHKGKGLKKYEV